MPSPIYLGTELGDRRWRYEAPPKALNSAWAATVPLTIACVRGCEFFPHEGVAASCWRVSHNEMADPGSDPLRRGAARDSTCLLKQGRNKGVFVGRPTSKEKPHEKIRLSLPYPGLSNIFCSAVNGEKPIAVNDKGPSVEGHTVPNQAAHSKQLQIGSPRQRLGHPDGSTCMQEGGWVLERPDPHVQPEGQALSKCQAIAAWTM
jgi:hypothetical protein